MKSKNIPADVKSKSIKETKEEINNILNKLEIDLCSVFLLKGNIFE